MKFEVGDEVRWKSQAAGSVKEKRGRIAQIVFPGDRPSRSRFEKLYRGSGVGHSRPEFSFVVVVRGPRGAERAYWPHASLLTKVEPAPAADAVGLSVD